jgi:transcriptional regulator with XRE-family HTH domain
MNNSTDIGRNIIRLREARGLSQAELGRRLGLSRRTMCSYEKSERRLPSGLIGELCTVLGVTSDQLLGVVPLQLDGRSADAKLQRKLDLVAALPETDRKVILEMIDLLARKNALA